MFHPAEPSNPDSEPMKKAREILELSQQDGYNLTYARHLYGAPGELTEKDFINLADDYNLPLYKVMRGFG
jgi:hypothetical protein